MPTFDVVSEVDMHELSNAVDQANREVANRFDFKDSGAKYDQNENIISMHAESEFQLDQMQDILRTKLAKREIDVACLTVEDANVAGKEARQDITLRQGIEAALAKKIVKMIKDKKMKVQAAIQGEKIRVTGKKRDDLQAVMALLREADLDMPLQYENFRD